ncbi:221_t:CDS:1, partial [Gigaspora rosea]
MSKKSTKLSPYERLRGAPINETTIDFPKSPVYNEENPTYNLVPTSPTSDTTN